MDDTNTPTLPAGPNAEPKCHYVIDSPLSLTDSMLEFAQRTGANVKFSVFTGDVVEGQSNYV